MRVAISQPEHFPYLGFFQKMCAVDLFIILDDVQFSGPRSFQNRNRYLDRHGDYQWFTVPVKKGSYFQTIREVEVASDRVWRKKLKRRLEQDLKFCCFDEVYYSGKLFEINMASIDYCRHAFDIQTPMIYSSDLHVSGIKAERIHNICDILGADVYVAGLGSMEYMKDADFGNIKIEFFHPIIDNYESSLVYAIKSSESIIAQMQMIKSEPYLFCKGK